MSSQSRLYMQGGGPDFIGNCGNGQHDGEERGMRSCKAGAFEDTAMAADASDKAIGITGETGMDGFPRVRSQTSIRIVYLPESQSLHY